MACIPTRERLLEDAVVPMCQSPKIVNVLVHVKGLPANDNCPFAAPCVKSFQAKGRFAAIWQAFRVLLSVRVLLPF